MEPALVSSLFLCEPLWTQSLRAVLQCPSQLLQHGSHLLNWVSHLSQAMGKLMYTLFYMGFNNNNKKWQKQQCMENPASERGRRDMVLLSKCWARPLRTQNSNHAAERLSASTIYCPVRGLVTREAFTPRQGGQSGASRLTTLHAVNKHWSNPAQDSAYDPSSGLAPSHSLQTSFHILSGSLGSNKKGNTRIRLRNSMSGPGLPWETQLLTQESVNRCGWRCQL